MRKLYKSKFIIYLLTLLMVFSSIPMETVWANDINSVEEINIDNLEKDEKIIDEEIIDEEVADEEIIDDKIMEDEIIEDEIINVPKSEEDNVSEKACLLNELCILEDEHEGDCQFKIEENTVSGFDNTQDLGAVVENKEIQISNNDSIEKDLELELNWVSYPDTIYTLNGDELFGRTASPESLDVKYNLHIKASGSYKKGEIQVRIPYCFMPDTVIGLGIVPGYIDLPESENNSSELDFYYSIEGEESEREIVITNGRDIEATDINIPISYKISPTKIGDMKKGAVQAKGTVTNGENVIEVVSNSLLHQLDTGFEMNTFPLYGSTAISQKSQLDASYDLTNFRYIDYHVKVNIKQKSAETKCIFQLQNVDGCPAGELVYVEHAENIGDGKWVIEEIDDTKKQSWTTLRVKYPKTLDPTTYKAKILLDVISVGNKYVEGQNLIDHFSDSIELSYEFKTDYEPDEPKVLNWFKASDNNLSFVNLNRDIVVGMKRLLATFDGNLMSSNEKQKWILETGEIYLNDVNKLLSKDDYEIANIETISILYTNLDEETYKYIGCPDFEGGELIFSAYDESGWKDIMIYPIDPIYNRNNTQKLLQLSSTSDALQKLSDILEKGHYTKIKITSPEVGRGRLEFSFDYSIRIKSTSPIIKDYLNNQPDSISINHKNATYKHYTITEQTEFLDYSCLKDGDGLHVINEAKYASGLYKTQTTSSISNGKKYFNNTIYAGEATDFTPAVSDVDLTLYNEIYNSQGVIYDLLPKGYCYEKMGTAVFRLNESSNDKKFVILDSVETIDNWKGTGRQLVIFRLRSKPNENYKIADNYNQNLFPDFYKKRIFCSGFRIDYRTSVTDEDLIYTLDEDYSLVAYQKDGKLYTGGCSDNGIPSSQEIKTVFDKIEDANGNPIFADLDNDGLVSENSTLYNFCKTSQINNEENTSQLSMYTGIIDKTNATLGFEKKCDITRGDDYSYRITIKNTKDETISNLVIYNILEEASINEVKGDWKGTIQSIDITPLKQLGIDPIVYYSTVAPDKLSYYESDDNPNGRALSKIRTSNWLNEELDGDKVWKPLDSHTDYSKISAIAVDMRKDKNGNNYILPQNMPIYFTYNMKSPARENLYAGLALNQPAFSYSINGQGEEGLLGAITQCEVASVVAKGKKIWSDNFYGSDNYYQKRPDSITVKLLANKVEVDEKTVTAQDNWQWEFNYLDKYDQDGKEIAYSFQEVAVDNYSSKITGTPCSANGATITNSYRPKDTYSINLKVAWYDGLNDWERTYDPYPKCDLLEKNGNIFWYSLGFAGNYNYNITTISKYIGDEENEISIANLVVPDGYICEYDIVKDNTNNIILLDFAFIKSQNVNGIKTWIGDDGFENKRPTSIEVGIYRTDSNKNSSKDPLEMLTVTPDDEGNWTYVFTDVPVYDKDGNIAEYVVREKEVADYTASYEGNVEEGFEITNTYSPKPPKDDSDDDEPIVPEPNPEPKPDPKPEPKPNPKPTPKPEPVPEPIPENEPIKKPIPGTNSDGDDDSSIPGVLPKIITPDYAIHVPQVGLDAAVLGARRALDCAVLGKRRQPGTGDDITLFLWIGLFVFGFISTSCCIVFYSMNKKKDGIV